MNPQQPLTELSAQPDSLSTTSERSFRDETNQSRAMSTPGLAEDSRLTGSIEESTSALEGDEGDRRQGDPSAATPTSNSPIGDQHLPLYIDMLTQTDAGQRPPIELRAHFEDFAAQLRSHRHNQHKRRMLEHRRQYLQKAVALSGRLQRLTSWVQDGLVEISRNDDSSNTSSFVRVQQHIQDLSDVCVSQWNHEIQALDPVNSLHDLDHPPSDDTFLDRLSPASQRECLDFLHAIRSTPRYLIDRFKAVSPAQLQALSTTPRYSSLPTSILESLSQNSGKSSLRRQRIQSYSKSLELYATSFERQNAINFLLFNCFGSDEPENTLRTSTWASICAGLFEEARPAFNAIIYQVLSGFVTLGSWPARERVDLFLMDVLQRGAFVVEPFDVNRSTSSLHSSLSDHVETDQTREFFDDAVARLFDILYFEGGIPEKALELARVIEGRLEDPELQNEFRAFFIFEWFIRYFLKITINTPENESMLLQFHVSPAARKRILVQLHHRADLAARQVYVPDPDKSVNERVEYCVHSLVGLVSAEHIQAPYPIAESQTPETTTLSALTICAADLSQVLDALGQQYTDLVLSSSLSAFTSQYPTANTGFRRLRMELLTLQEPANGHPCQENWLILPVQQDGRPGGPRKLVAAARAAPPIAQLLSAHLGDLDAAQKAALRLVLEDPIVNGATLIGVAQTDSTYRSLADTFRERQRYAANAADNLDAFYWSSALDYLTDRYPSATWGQDDARILRPLLQALVESDPISESLDVIQAQINRLEDTYAACKRSLEASLKRLHQMKVRLWYVTAVVISRAYEDAKNISRALNYMALSTSTTLDTSTTSSEHMRPSTSASTASSMFEQTPVDTMNLLRAPKEHGGARKLADEQVQITKKWLERSGIENLCKGEERIHRFCMEIRVTARKLVGETFAESPVLWSSDLWAKEKQMYEVGAPGAFNIHGGTRSPSVMSETFSSTHYHSRPPLGPLTFSSRSLDIDTASSQGRRSSFYSSGSHRLNREMLGNDGSISLSPGRSLTTTSGESVFSAWSPLPSQRSATSSLSAPSRAASIANEVTVPRVADPSVEKSKFLSDLQQDLTTLLLSDLGNPVWCQGSETDNWIGNARHNSNITTRLDRHEAISRLMPSPQTGKTSKSTKDATARRPNPKRRTWSADMVIQGNQSLESQKPDRSQNLPSAVAMGDLQDVLERISNHIDPRLKLDAVHEFKVLAVRSRPASPKPSSQSMQASVPTSGPRRRARSMGPKKRAVSQDQPKSESGLEMQSEITQYLKTILLQLRHRTLFRDLQYIAAFVSIDTLNNTEKGRAFWHVGLGALACKDEYCRTMVDLADKIVTRDSIKRRAAEADKKEEGLFRAKDYWILAAREGNSIAQRELASLYLAHPEVPPVVSLPLSLCQEVFKDDMKWKEGWEGNPQSFQLAMHWMQLAASNGDKVAKERVKERTKEETSSLH